MTRKAISWTDEMPGHCMRYQSVQLKMCTCCYLDGASICGCKGVPSAASERAWLRLHAADDRARMRMGHTLEKRKPTPPFRRQYYNASTADMAHPTMRVSVLYFVAVCLTKSLLAV